MIETATARTASPLEAILNPGNVAIIGASQDPTKRGHHIVRALLDSGYRGRIQPVNPAGGELLGLPVAKRIADLASTPDLAVICTPASTVPEVLRECAGIGVRGAISLAVGFGETGDKGLQLEDELRQIVRETGIRLAGPNTSGLLNTATGLNLIGMRGVRPGPLALLVQSGNLTLQLVTESATRSETGFRYCIGVGNETDIRFHEYLEYLCADENVRAILMHAEGFRAGREFLEAAAYVTRRKPIVLLKGARSNAGTAAARSHTGAVAGDYRVFRAAMRQAGVIEVTRTDELFAVGQALATQPAVPVGKKVAVLSDGGGHSALAVDAFGPGTELAMLSASTREQLRALLGNAAAVNNPVDLAGAADGNPRVFARALRLIAADPGVGAVLVVGLFGGYALRFASSLLTAELQSATAMVEFADSQRIALVVHSLYASSRSAPLQAMTAAGVPVVESLEVACRCTDALSERGRMITRAEQAILPRRPHGYDGAADFLADARADERSVLLEPEARDLLMAHLVPMVPARWCRTAVEATIAAREVGGPVAIKIVSPQASHKTEAGGVELSVAPIDAEDKFEETMNNVADYCRRRGLPPDVRGAMVSPMLPAPMAELLIGARRDHQFGPVLVIGAGGTAVELLDQVAIRILPLDRRDVREMLEELSVTKLLKGYRNQPVANLDPVIEAALSVADVMLLHPEIESIEINPLFAYRDRAVAIDARVFLQNPPA